MSDHFRHCHHCERIFYTKTGFELHLKSLEIKNEPSNDDEVVTDQEHAKTLQKKLPKCESSIKVEIEPTTTTTLSASENVDELQEQLFKVKNEKDDFKQEVLRDLKEESKATVDAAPPSGDKNGNPMKIKN